jgi:hypothetical protein
MKDLSLRCKIFPLQALSPVLRKKYKEYENAKNKGKIMKEKLKTRQQIEHRNKKKEKKKKKKKKEQN